MPFYCYRRQDGVVIQRFFNMGKQPKRVKCRDGKFAQRDMVSEWKGRQDTPSNWPMECVALGVHPNQVPAMRKRYPHHEFNADGNMVIRSQAQYNQVMKDTGTFDRDGFSGASPRNA